MRNAGIRVRGRTSRSPEKPALRIDFNRYVAEQEFLGLKSLALDNLWQDPSMIRERLAMLVFRRMGVPAPRESHAGVRRPASREFVGVYGIVEVIDRFLETQPGEEEGYRTNTSGRSLTVPESTRGSRLVRDPIRTEDARIGRTLCAVCANQGRVQTINDADESRLGGSAPAVSRRQEIHQAHRHREFPVGARRPSRRPGV